MNLVESRNTALWRDREQCAHTDLRHENTDGAAGESHERALREQLSRDAETTCAERHADGHLSAPRRGADEQQVGDVRAGDQEHECDGTGKNE